MPSPVAQVNVCDYELPVIQVSYRGIIVNPLDFWSPRNFIAADIGPDWRELRSWEVERWFERLPMYLLEEPKRQKVLKALHKTLALVETGKL